jgi:hypothetical protein
VKAALVVLLLIEAAGSMTWRSDRCGARTYPRLITFKTDGTFEAFDLVAPCPARAQCKWSGVVTRKGRWKDVGRTRVLTIDDDLRAELGRALPTELELTTSGAPSESIDGGSCSYVPAS